MYAASPKWQAWRLANQEVQFAEERLRLALEPPQADPEVLHERTRDLALRREQAHALFADAMEEMKGIAESLHYRSAISRACSRMAQHSRGTKPSFAADKSDEPE
jgi:hypothetical protein